MARIRSSPSLSFTRCSGSIPLPVQRCRQYFFSFRAYSWSRPPCPVAAMHFPSALTRQRSSDSFGPRKTTPWIASPLAQEVPEHSNPHVEKTHTTERIVEFNENQHDLHRTPSSPDEPIFREHHESSTVELFFDLFFVANLATFTANHEIVDTSSLKNYLGFFTLLWFTWLQYSLFDVRLSTGMYLHPPRMSISA